MTPSTRSPRVWQMFNVNDVFGLLHLFFLGMSTGQCVFVAINEKDAKKTLHISISQHLLVQ
jgi:hypothetical protein